MHWNRSFSIVFVLVMAGPALAQHPQNRGVHPGGMNPGSVHPGMQRGMISPEEQMMHDFYMQQLWMQQMMEAQRNAGRGQGRSTVNPNYSGNRTRSNTTPAETYTIHGSSSGATEQQSHQPSDNQGERDNGKARKANHHDAEPKNLHHENARPNANARGTQGKKKTSTSRGSDNVTIQLLKNAHGRLRKADADYNGHRVRAMEHIASAIHSLGLREFAGGLNGAFDVGYTFGVGKLPQAQSDGILQDAIVTLRQVDGSLPTGSGAVAHHHEARRSVTEAIHQLELALHTR